MRLLNLLFFITLPTIYARRLFSNIKSNIKNVEKPICMKCKHYITESYNVFSSSNNKCCIFGAKDIHNGDIRYDYVSECRKDEEKCGIDGTYFEKQNNIYFKKLKHNLSRNYLYYYCFITVLLQIIVITKKNIN
jgi:hypothetical protein